MPSEIIAKKQLLKDVLQRDMERYLVDKETDMFHSPECAHRLILEYIDITKTSKGNHIQKIEENITKQTVRLDQVVIFCHSLMQVYDPFIAGILRNYIGLGMQFSEDSYIKDIEILNKQLVSNKIKLSELQSERDSLKNTEKSEPVSYKGFAKTTLALCRDLGYHLPKDVSALEWALAKKEYNDKLEMK